MSGEIADLATLLEYVAEIPGIERIRYTTSHPKEMTPRLIAAYGSVDKLVSHLHLPVQSGSDRVLAAMKRGYTALEYKSIVRRLRAVRPELSLTSDFIIGFPGETDADFAQTMKLVDDVGFDGAFSFAYSPRPGTPAAELPDQVAPARAAGAPRAAAGAARRPVRRPQRRDGRHPAARAGDRPRARRTRASSPARTDNNRVVNFAGDADADRQLRRRHDHRRAGALAARRTGRRAMTQRAPTRRRRARPNVIPERSPAPTGEVIKMSTKSPFLFSRTRVALALAGAALALGGCATAPDAPDASGAAPAAQTTDTAKVAAAVAAGVTAGNAASARPGASPASVAQAVGAAAAAATGPKPFAEVIKDAKETAGLFRIWQKDEKVWIEIAPEQFGVPYLFTVNLSRGLGEQGVYGGMMIGDQIVEFKRIGNNVQLIAKNYAFTGGTNAPIAQGVKEGFTDSLLGASTVVSQPHPERKTVLIEANALFLTDIPVGERFTTGIHMRSYTFDAKNSSFDAVKISDDQASFIVSAHYQNPRATLPPAPSPTPPPPNPFPPFTTLPDGRSLFLGYTYNIAKLPGADGRAPG